MSEISDLQGDVDAIKDILDAVFSTPTGQNILREFQLQKVVDQETAEHPWFKAWIADGRS